MFHPIYKPRIWGGDRIFTHFARRPATAEPIGESWELADLEENQSRIRGGPRDGRPLGELRAEAGRELLGDVPLFEGRFPLLIKFLDAQTRLSVQVHPTEAVARKLGGHVRVKHEAWYVLAAEPDGAIYHGLEPGVTAGVFREAMLSGKVERVLRRVPVRVGQCYYLPSGTVHALGAGVLVAEIQTPSDITYRTYDWGRVDPSTGRPRALHLNQAMECIDFGGPQPQPTQPLSPVAAEGASVSRVTTCESFLIDRVEMVGGAGRTIAGGEPVVWIVLDGSGSIEGPPEAAFSRGDVILLPAAMGNIQVRAEGSLTCLEVTVPH